ncbi:hypothetical protein VTO73DRAFT_4464 [Trametes versicolor]
MLPTAADVLFLEFGVVAATPGQSPVKDGVRSSGEEADLSPISAVVPGYANDRDLQFGTHTSVAISEPDSHDVPRAVRRVHVQSGLRLGEWRCISVSNSLATSLAAQLILGFVQTTMKLLDLSSDLLVTLFEAADVRSLSRCREVCRALHDLVDRTSLGYNLELHAAGLVRNTSQYPEEAALDELPMEEKTARIRRHRQAWRGLSFAPPVTTGANMLYLIAPELRRFHPSGIVAQMTEDQDLSFIRFPTPLGAQERESWTIPAETLDIPHGIDVFAIDPAQDLLVIVWRMHEGGGAGVWHMSFKSMRSGLEHPRALVPTRCLDEAAVMQDLPQIDIRGDTVVLQYRMRSTSLWLFNWETAFVRHQFHSPNTLYWSLLPADLLVAANLGSVAVGVLPAGSTDLRLKCVLTLPEWLSDMSFYLALSPGGTGRRAPFCCPDDATETVILTVCSDTGAARAFVAVPCAVLLEYANRFAETPSDGLPQIAWDEWSPRVYAEFWEGEAVVRGAAKALLSCEPRCATLLPDTSLRILELGPAVVTGGGGAGAEPDVAAAEPNATAGSALPASSDANLGPTRVMESPSIRSRARTVPLGIKLPNERVQVYTWDNGALLQAGPTMAVFSLQT